MVYYCDLNDIDVDLSNGKVTFDFSDSGWSDEEFNENHSIDIKRIVTDGKLDMDKFKIALKDSAADAVKRMNETK